MAPSFHVLINAINAAIIKFFQVPTSSLSSQVKDNEPDIVRPMLEEIAALKERVASLEAQLARSHQEVVQLKSLSAPRRVGPLSLLSHNNYDKTPIRVVTVTKYDDDDDDDDDDNTSIHVCCSVCI